MHYDITATLGPASRSEAVWKSMLEAGAGSFRLNTSHLSLAQLEEWMHRAGAFFRSLEREVPLVLDLQGSKWRLGDFAPCFLEQGRLVEFACAPSTGLSGVLPVPHEDFFLAAGVSGGEILLNDAKVSLEREPSSEGAVRARVVRGGEISPNKGITFASCGYRAERLGEKDQAILGMTRGMPFVRYAVSYVKDAEEMSRYRAALGDGAHVAAKIERGTAIEDAPLIARWADELWLCRGDLGAELGLRDMARACRRFTQAAAGLSVPVKLAGQVLEHMVKSAAPTRSEVCCIHDALAQGFRGLVLSDETAVGNYPVEACRQAALFRD